MTVLIIVIIVPIVVFGITFFITSSVTRHDAQDRKMTALYLAQAGIHRAIFNIEAAISPVLNVTLDGNTIAVTVVAQCSTVYQLKSIGTSVTSSNSISRTVFAQYDSATNNVSIYLENDGSLIQPPTCCNQLWWPFSEGSGTTTGTAPYVGTLTGTAPVATRPAWVTGRVGNALSFNQGTATNNYVLVPDSPGLDLTNSGTIMAWIYMTAQAPTSAGIIRRGSATSSTAQEAYGLIISLNGSNRRIRFILCESDGGTQRNVTGNTNLAINTWYHVTGTWGANGMRVYLNGVLQASNATVRSSYATTSPLFIGTYQASLNTRDFPGTIDEVYLYACEKTAAEILAYYNATKP